MDTQKHEKECLQKSAVICQPLLIYFTGSYKRKTAGIFQPFSTPGGT